MNEDRASRYHRLRRRVSLGATALVAGWLLLLLLTGWSAAIRDAATVVAGRSPVLTVVCYVVSLVALTEAVRLPLAFYQGVTLERRYALSTQTTVRWWIDRLKASAVELTLGVAGALVVWFFLRWSPERWWLATSLCFVSALVLLAHAGPVLLFPIFHACRPLQRPGLQARLVRLAERADTRVLGVFEWRLGDRTRKANAALAGIGRTRRILLSDTLLAEHADDEIEVVLAHELAHHVHHDIWKALALEAALILSGFYLAHRALGVAVGHFGLAAGADIAALPLLVLAAGAVSLGALPLANALSRAHERRADRYALDVTGNAEAFVRAMRRLAARNLAEERPSGLARVLFHSHPPVAARIEAARAWEAGRTRPRANLDPLLPRATETRSHGGE